MNHLQLVLETLEKNGLRPTVEEESFKGGLFKRIRWDDPQKGICQIYESDIDYQDGKLAWFQSIEDGSDFLLVVIEHEEPFEWTPITHNPFFGCFCILLEWYKEHLIFIYQEKHGIYICSIRNSSVNHIRFHGEEIERKGDIVTYQTYGKPSEKISAVKIPELEIMPPIDRQEAEKMDLIPQGLNRPDNFLKHK